MQNFSLESIEITDEEFKLLSDLIYKNFGIYLGPQKKALVAGRLNKVLKSMGFKTFKEYYNYVINDKTNEALTVLANKISTNHTFFYREKEHFIFLYEEVLPSVIENLYINRENELRIWCAAAATGEEPYTIAFFVNEFLKNNNIQDIDFIILATDISLSALEKAYYGIYDYEKIKELPVELLNKYFYKISEDEYLVREEIKNKIVFKKFNLMREIYPFKKKFHIIFCRNVMIYFDKETKDKLDKKLYDVIAKKGYLFIGHSETLSRNITNFRFIRPAVYYKE